MIPADTRSDRTGDERAGGPESIGQILQRVAGGIRPRRRIGRARNRVHEAWRRAAGKELELETRPGPLNKGTLTVEVRSASLLNELDGFRRHELLSRLVEEDSSGRVTGLRFRLAVFYPEQDSRS